MNRKIKLTSLKTRLFQNSNWQEFWGTSKYGKTFLLTQLLPIFFSVFWPFCVALINADKNLRFGQTLPPLLGQNPLKLKCRAARVANNKSLKYLTKCCSESSHSSFQTRIYLKEIWWKYISAKRRKVPLCCRIFYSWKVGTWINTELTGCRIKRSKLEDFCHKENQR